MKDRIIEVFKKYSKSVDTEYNVYNCLIEEDWSNVADELVILFNPPDIKERGKELLDLINKAQTPQGNMVIDYLMKKMKEQK